MSRGAVVPLPVRSPVLAAVLVGALAGAPAVALAPPPQRSVLQLDALDLVQAPPVPALALGGEFTVELWVRLYAAASPGEARLFTKRAPGYGVAPAVELWGEAGLTPVFHVATASELLGVEGPPLTLGAWHHVAAAFGGGALTLFVDGVASSSPAPAGAMPAVGAGEVFVVGQGLRGAVRQGRVWSRPLGAAEVAERAAAVVTGGEPGLVAAWPLDDGSGQTARDLGPHAIPLQLFLDWSSGKPVWARTAVVDAPYFAVHTSRTAREAEVGGLLDLDLDGVLDLLGWFTDYAAYVPQPFHAYRNQGWVFGESTEALIAPPRPELEGLGRPPLIADLTGDGLDDVLAPDFGPDSYPVTGGRPFILVRQPDGTLADETATRTPPLAVLSHGWTHGDVDGDGDPDVVLVAYGANTTPMETTRLLLNDGSGHFTESTDWLQAEWGFAPLGGELFDADGDGDNDLFLGASMGQYPITRERDRLLLNDGAGHFSDAPPTALPPRYRGYGWSSYDQEAADFDGDGDLDLAVILYAVDPTMGVAGTRLLLLLSDGKGSFRDGSLGIPQGTTPTGGATIWARDVNGDGRVDLVYAFAQHVAHLYLNTGGARFVDAGEALPASHGSLFPGDVDGDGDLDLAMLPLYRQEIVALEQVRAVDLATWNDFSLCVEPAHLDVPQGKAAPMLLAVNRGGFAAPVELSASSPAAGLTFGFSSATIAGDEVVTLTVGAPAGVAPGRYPARVTARAGDAVHSQEIVVIVGREPMKRRRGTQTSP